MAADQAPGSRSEAAAEHWSRYWRAGYLHSCPNAFRGNYADELRELWHEFFHCLPARARLLDIGTGNGAIAFMARDVSGAAQKDFDIHAIDAAQIEPERAAAALGTDASGIAFRGSLPLEANEFDSGSFDAVSGQFALEYTELGAAAAQLSRLLKPCGRGLFVLHHAESMAVRTAQRDLAHLDVVLGELQLTHHARSFANHVSPARTSAELKALAEGAEGRQMLANLNAAARLVHERQRSDSSAQWLQGVTSQLAAVLQDTAQLNVAVAMHRLDVLDTEMQAHRQRLADIIRCAQSSTDILRTATTLQTAGLASEPPRELLIRGGELIGWMLRIEKPVATAGGTS
jgi:SAM-dependent methyltransferase